jgi:hypothetical protein
MSSEVASLGMQEPTSGAAALTAQVQRLRRNADAAAARLRLAFGGAL